MSAFAAENRTARLLSSISSKMAERSTAAIARLMTETKALNIIAFVLRFIETLQIVFLLFHPNIKSMWKHNIYTYLINALTFLSYDTFMLPSLWDIKKIVLYIILAINTAVMVIFGLMVLTLTFNDILSAIKKVIIRVLAIYVLFFKCLLIIPMAQVSYLNLFCGDDYMSRSSLLC